MYIPSPHTDSKACLCSVISGSPCYLQRAWSASCHSMIWSWFRTWVSPHRTAKKKSKWYMRADETCILAFGQWEMKTSNTQRWPVWMKWTQCFIQGWPLEKDVFLFLGNLCSLSKTAVLFPLECLHHYVQSHQEKPYYSQLKAVRDPCSCSSQIPLRQT